MSRLTPKQARRQRRDAHRRFRASQEKFHAVHLARHTRHYDILLESEGAARVVCLKCGLEQSYVASGSSNPPGYAPCPWCDHDLCQTVEAYVEENPAHAAP
jgi:rubrerythrin